MLEAWRNLDLISNELIMNPTARNTITMKDNLLQEIYKFFVNSSDFNGMSLESVSYPIDKIQDSLIDLIKEDKVCMLSKSFDGNPNIIRFGFPSKEEQVEYVKNYSCEKDLILYPSPSYLNVNRDVSEFQMQPFERMMALGYPQLKSCYFDYDVLMHYAFDPRMNFKFNDYQGNIHSENDVDERSYINLKTFGIGRNGDSIVIVAYARDLKDMSTMNQYIWYGHMIQDTTNCKVLKAYQDNQFRESFVFPNTVYRAILKEIININDLTASVFKKQFFREDFSKEALEKFDMLPFPSLDSYNQFLLLIEKIVIHNIDIHFFEEFFCIKDDNGKTRGSLDCLKEWINQVNESVCNKIINPLRVLRKERQDPAHKIQSNLYSNDYLSKQHELCKSIYNSLYLFRRLLQSHPELKEFTLKYPNTQYIEI